MKKAGILVLLLCCIGLGGCRNWLDGQYVSVKPFREEVSGKTETITEVHNYEELLAALRAMVFDGVESHTMSTPDFTQELAANQMTKAVYFMMHEDPVGAFVLRDLTFEQGTSGGVNAIAVKAKYNNNSAELVGMKRANSMKDVRRVISSALNACEASTVVLVQHYEDMDFSQYVQDYGDEHPDILMEIPVVSVSAYPDSGRQRVIQIQFGYKTNRQTLRTMQATVQPVFASARLYVSEDAEEHEKYTQLYSFLMERYQYDFETSITPSYSLLRHGVGDSKAFAVVYAAMCRDVGLECQVVSGTKNGEAHFWNLICDGGVYYHVDLMRCEELGTFQELSDLDMNGYVWDYSAYPSCDSQKASEAETSSGDKENTSG